MWLRLNLLTYHWWVGWPSDRNRMVNALYLELGICLLQLAAAISGVNVAPFSGVLL